MISTRTFSRQASMWATLTPTMEHVIRWINANTRRVADRVPATGGDPGKSALIAETAFALAASRESVPERVTNADTYAVRRYLTTFSANPPSDVELDADELEEVAALARSLDHIVRSLGEPHYWPAIPGCGVVDAAHADVLIGNTLVEVKSVSRNYRAPDVRQLLTYCAMLDASGTKTTNVGLVNPRLGLVAVASLEFVCQGASGLSSAGLLREIERRMADLQVSA